ncbi:hypothetical protein Btru_007521 [Bulinus truncatus]|nr:hypothetical protein Btru_007521 [Bulinus truncatus]
MSKSLVSCIGLKVSQLKVMCGLSVASSEMEGGAVEAAGCEPIPSGVFLRVYKQKLQGKQLATEFKVS